MVSDVQLAWAAGVIDGDGCVTLDSPGAARCGTKRRRPAVIVDSTDIEILTELQTLFGGSLVKKRRQQPHHRQAWSWRLYGADLVLALLRGVLPYMRCAVKVQRAALLVEQYKQTTPRNGRYTPELLVRRAAFEQQFMAIGAGRGSQNRLTGSGGR
jgi:hypothetical protein